MKPTKRTKFAIFEYRPKPKKTAHGPNLHFSPIFIFYETGFSRVAQLGLILDMNLKEDKISLLSKDEDLLRSYIGTN